MKSKYIFFIFLISLFDVSFSQEADFYPNKITVRFIQSSAKSDTKQGVLEQIELHASCKVISLKPMFKVLQEPDSNSKIDFQLSSIYELELSDGENLWNVISLLNQRDDVKYAEPVYKVNVFETPNDPQLVSQYYLPLIKAFEAYEITHGDTNVVLGIVDTGIDYFHEDLQANFKYNYYDTINGIDDDMDGFVDNYRGWDFGENDNNAQSEFSHHGTIVAGMSSAVTNNEIGIAGIGYRTKILPIKVMDYTGDMITAYSGVIYAADHGCQIINCSWGGTSYSQLGADVIDYAINSKNCLVIAAAGNSKTNISYYPASFSGVLSVAATDWADLKWTGSSYSINVDICAPGSNVRSTNQNNSYINGYGTSFASPLVAGVAALIKANRPELNAVQLAEQLRITADIIDTIPDNQYFYHKMGYGRVNALRALSIKSLPSIRIQNVTFETNNSASLLNGDTLIVIFSAINYLADVTNCVIKLTSNSEYITPIQNIMNTGALESLQEVSNFNHPMFFKISNQIPENATVQFTFEMVAPNNDGINTASNYKDYQIFTCIFNKAYINISPNKITTTLTSDGKIGYQNRNENIGKGFIYNNQQNLLNEGGIILATDKEHMASSFFDITEFQTLKIIDTISVGDSLLVGYCTYKPVENINIPITINQKIIAYKTGIWESAIIHEYSITNNGAFFLNNLHISIFTDWNIGNSAANSMTYNSELNMLYSYNHSNQILYTGVCLLSPGNTLPYGFDLVSGGNGGVDISDGFNNDEKWFATNNLRTTAGNSGDTIDIASLLTAGPYTIAAHDSTSLSWALIVAKNQYELTEIARTLQEKYILSHKNQLVLKNYWDIFPNPAKESIIIENSGINTEVQVFLYNSVGILCEKILTNEKIIKLNTLNLRSGLYLIQIKEGEKNYTKKIIISH